MIERCRRRKYLPVLHVGPRAPTKRNGGRAGGGRRGQQTPNENYTARIMAMEIKMQKQCEMNSNARVHSGSRCSLLPRPPPIVSADGILSPQRGTHSHSIFFFFFTGEIIIIYVARVRNTTDALSAAPACHCSVLFFFTRPVDATTRSL